MNFTNIKNLTADQLRVMSADSDIVVKGSAGTGKTAICILKARQLSEKGNTVAILIATKALKNFIQKAFAHYQVTNCAVFHQFEWFSETENTFDFILIDEAQDFSLNLITRIRAFARKGIYILGDSGQQIFEKTFYNNEPTICVEEVAAHLGFPLIEMKESIRVTRRLVDFMTAWNNSVVVPESMKEGEAKPIFIQCDSYSHQLQMLVKLISDKIGTGTIGIFLETNDSKRIYESNELRPGILELYSHLNEQKINNLGYKYKQQDSLQFQNDNTVNILTFHSAKGLEFNHVIIPFFDSNFNNHNNNCKINYVGFTRTVGTITLLYTNTVSRNFPIIKNRSLYDGNLKYTDYSGIASSHVANYNKAVDSLQNIVNAGAYTKKEAMDELRKFDVFILVAKEKLKLSGYNEQEIATFFRKNQLNELY